MFFSDHRIAAVSRLGQFLREFSSDSPISGGLADIAEELKVAVTKSHRHNGWFITDNVMFAISSWGDALTEEHLNLWRSSEGVSKR